MRDPVVRQVVSPDPQQGLLVQPLQLSNFCCRRNITNVLGADLGFLVGGGANLLGGAPTYDFAKFSKIKKHEIGNILLRWGRGEVLP